MHGLGAARLKIRGLYFREMWELFLAGYLVLCLERAGLISRPGGVKGLDWAFNGIESGLEYEGLKSTTTYIYIYMYIYVYIYIYMYSDATKYPTWKKSVKAMLTGPLVRARKSLAGIGPVSNLGHDNSRVPPYRALYLFRLCEHRLAAASMAAHAGSHAEDIGLVAPLK